MGRTRFMEDKLVSVIVPIYNVEKYLPKCLKSIIEQTYQNIEIILVDDGSTDSSRTIIDDYAYMDSRIKVIHQENGGLSNARNNGMDIATGEYFTFVDSDDYLENDYIDFMYRLLEKSNFQAKMALCSLNNVYLATGSTKSCGNDTYATLSGKEAIQMMCYHNLVDTCAYAKLTHRSLYRNVRFPEGKLFEDIATTYLLFAQCDIVECGFFPKYNYVLRDDSITTSKFNERKLDLLDMTDEMATYVGRKYPDLKEAVLRRQVYARFSTLNQMLNVSTPEDLKSREEILKYLRENRASIFSDPMVPKRDKIGYYMLSGGFKIYKLAWGCYLKLMKRK
ncbi:hypothetical protein LEQ_2318 [Ligilactobacillus equi DPC 6820]|uniref:Glycosyltransferase 2-like domain-containing protein n=2 Tax=Ligilactobacillus equi TaxID=137357 RepID=V7HYP9_9LACO|nr:hypothetical protein LEQ_2318 [Ligilactobacillus equi DPC 6820]